MKVLLILPPISNSGSWGLVPRAAPFITLSVAAHLRKASFAVDICDAFLENASFQDILSGVDRYQPDIIGVPLVEIIREFPLECSLSMIQYLKSNRPKIIIAAFGNKDIEFMSDYLEKNEGIDYYIAGDPEETMVDLAQFLNKRKAITSIAIKGLLFKNETKVIFTGIRVMENLDRLEFPAWDLVNLNKYFIAPHRYRNIQFYPLISTRGCHWAKCTFCIDEDNIIRYLPYRAMSPKRVVKEIVYASQKYGCKEIQFFEQQFNTDKEWLLKLESELKKNKINISWSCLSRIDMVNPEVLSIMRRIGCWNILFGIESASERLLRVMNKGISLKQIERAVGWCKKSGIEVTGSFLIGLPKEEPRDVFNTVSFAQRIGIDYAQFFITKCLREHIEFKDDGCVADFWDFSRYDFYGRVFIPKSYKDIYHLKYIQRMAYLKFYMHPKVIVKHIKKVNNIQSLKRLFVAFDILLDLLRRKKGVSLRAP